MAKSTATRLHVEDHLVAGAEFDPGAERSHQLLRVLRLGAGDRVALFNAADGEWLAEIEDRGKGRCRLRVVEQGCPALGSEAARGPWLLFAPIKRTRLEFMVEKACELGVTRLLPVITRYTDPGRVNRERLRAIVTEAAEQCGRLSVPEVGEALPLLEVLDNWPAERSLVVCAERGEVRPIATVPPGPAAILIGPEGGFAPFELDRVSQLPFAFTAGLGPRVLRAETAALAALACWQAVVGDWTVEGRESRPWLPKAKSPS
ncbi:Ribosomal RNA small subunit methyltransferase E [uncultured Gammaproteobacteria bacterium]